ncbi:hypothetical protein [Agriterribacter sp.]|nr:hypothetical protein [Agriterribacter sp.]HRP58635.1 hypothetical protein [Agriterribacter sp.]
MKIKLPVTIAALMLWCCLTTKAQVIAKLTLPAQQHQCAGIYKS